MANKEVCNSMVDKDHKITVGPEVESTAHYSVYEGHLQSPMNDYFHEQIPEEARIAKFQLVLPKKWHHQTLKPICLHLAGTGDHVRMQSNHILLKL